jgi:hypothetical protein
MGTSTVVSGITVIDLLRKLTSAFLQYQYQPHHNQARLARIANLITPPADTSEPLPIAGVALRSTDEIFIFFSKPDYKLNRSRFDAFFSSENIFIREMFTGDFVPCAAAGDSIGFGAPTGPTGTLGCIVTDAAGDDFLLSCNHILANTNLGRVGVDEAWDPGRHDGGTAADRVALLQDFQKIDFGGAIPNEMDAAIAKPDSAVIISRAIPGIGIVGGTDPVPGYGIPVKKQGKVTGLTSGDLIFQRMSLVLPFAAGNALFVNQYGIVNATGSVFAQRGDSGSLVVNAANEGIGIVFCKASIGDVAVANPIDPILTRFGVHF